MVLIAGVVMSILTRVLFFLMFVACIAFGIILSLQSDDIESLKNINSIQTRMILDLQDQVNKNNHTNVWVYDGKEIILIGN